MSDLDYTPGHPYLILEHIPWISKSILGIPPGWISMFFIEVSLGYPFLIWATPPGYPYLILEHTFWISKSFFKHTPWMSKCYLTYLQDIHVYYWGNPWIFISDLGYTPWISMSDIHLWFGGIPGVILLGSPWISRMWSSVTSWISIVWSWVTP